MGIFLELCKGIVTFEEFKRGDLKFKMKNILLFPFALMVMVIFFAPILPMMLLWYVKYPFRRINEVIVKRRNRKKKEGGENE